MNELNEFVLFLNKVHNLDLSKELSSFKKELASTKALVFEIFTDGACRGNNGSRSKGNIFGGIGIWSEDYNLNISEKHPNATNNKMELLAILRAIQIISDIWKETPQKTVIWSDSMYSIKSVTVWYKNWEKNGWKNSKGADVENQDLIKPIIELLTKYSEFLDIKYVKGHSTSTGNNKADELATSALD